MTGEVWIGLCAVGFIMLVIEFLIVKYMIKQR